MHKFLSGGSNRVVAIHCKAGKGRTGLICAAYLLYTGVCKNAEAALILFGNQRTSSFKGVTVPSQIRYVKYFERYLKQYQRVSRPFPYDSVLLTLHHVRFTTVPHFHPTPTGGCTPSFQIYGPYPYNTQYYDHQVATKGKLTDFVSTKENILNHVDIPCGDKKISLFGDVKFVFFNLETGKEEREKMLSFSIHTSFVKNGYAVLTKEECDIAYKDKDNKNFVEAFKVELFFRSG